MEIDHIRAAAQSGDLELTHHATEKMAERDILMKEIRQATMSGRIIERYEEQGASPCCLMMGITDTGRPLHVVFCDKRTFISVITVYQPDPDRWNEDWSVRRSK